MNILDTMTTDASAPCITRTSGAMVVTMQKEVFVFYND